MTLLTHVLARIVDSDAQENLLVIYDAERLLLHLISKWSLKPNHCYSIDYIVYHRLQEYTGIPAGLANFFTCMFNVACELRIWPHST